ncbi:hypothetical protein GCM10009525_39650 [Streptosporangium amethystogenes subsp. fukuiense]
MRRMIRALLAVLSGTVLAFVTVPAIPAQAGTWGEYPTSSGNRTCSNSRTYNGTAYQVCLEFNSARTQVRAISFINPGAYTNFQVNMRLWFGGNGVSIPQSCPTMTTNGSRACWTGWTALRRPYVVADATFGIAGAWRTPVRALDMTLSAKYQEKSNWCGPGSAQTIIATMGISAPSQSSLADISETTALGTMPWMMKLGLNASVPQDFPYKDYDIPPSGTAREIGLNTIVTSLSRGRPVAVLVKPGQLPWSPNVSGSVRHYIVIHGYGGFETTNASHIPWMPMNFKVWDPGAGREESLTQEELFFAARGAQAVDDNIWAIAT